MTADVLGRVACGAPMARRQEGSDPYAWLRASGWPDVIDPEILDYLEAENRFTSEWMAPLVDLEDRLYEELMGHVRPVDESVPVFRPPYLYYTRRERSQPYAVLCRRFSADGLVDASGQEEILLDENAEALGSSYYGVCCATVSPDHRWLAYTEDRVGDEQYRLVLKDLRTGERIETGIDRVGGSLVWDTQNRGIFYLKNNEYLRADRLYFHVLGEDALASRCLYHEKDASYHLGLGVSSDRSWLILEASTGTTQEAHCLDLREPILGSLVCWWPRLEGRKYSLDHHRDRGFFVLTNDEGPNNRILHVTEMEQRNGEPTVWWNYDADRAIEGLTIQEDFLAVAWRREGLPQISVCRLDGTVRHAIDFPDPSYVAEPCGLPFESKFLRYRYSSLAHPVSYYEWHSGSGETVCRKVEMPASAYDVSWVRTERVWVTSADGTLVPVSLAYRHDRVTPGSGQAPCYLYGYGSYGIATDPYFRTGWLTLLNHGLVVAIAHIRGGDDMGTAWYEQAKFEHKHRSFDDFEAAIRGLCAQGWTAPDRMVIHGGSAGGMLMGVMANRLGTGVAAVVADVPFVDVRNTMMDASLPLTPGEYDEWGNPEDPKIDAAMRAYSPYDNVREQAYPAMWVTAGLYDPRVTYWEPAKWVAALRWARTNPEIPLCLWTKMEAGHAGASSRLAYWRDMAKCYSFVLDRLSHALEQREAP